MRRRAFIAAARRRGGVAARGARRSASKTQTLSFSPAWPGIGMLSLSATAKRQRHLPHPAASGDYPSFLR